MAPKTMLAERLWLDRQARRRLTGTRRRLCAEMGDPLFAAVFQRQALDVADLLTRAA